MVSSDPLSLAREARHGGDKTAAGVDGETVQPEEKEPASFLLQIPLPPPPPTHSVVTRRSGGAYLVVTAANPSPASLSADSGPVLFYCSTLGWRYNVEKSIMSADFNLGLCELKNKTQRNLSLYITITKFPTHGLFSDQSGIDSILKDILI